MSARIVVLANAVVDLSLAITHFPVLAAEHQDATDGLLTAGGQATTLIVGARLGLPMQVVGSLGADEAGKFWLACVAAEKVDVTNMVQMAGRATSISAVLSEPHGEHVFLAYSESTSTGPEQLPTNWETAIAEAAALLLDGYGFGTMGPATNLAAITVAKAAGVPIFFDPGPRINRASADWIKSHLSQLSVIVLTEEEAEMMIGVSLPPLEMVERIRCLGPTLVVLKRGAAGMIGHSATETVVQPGYPATVRDTTGAGDSVMAAVVAGYLANYSLEQMLVLANATGAAAVEKLGAGVRAPTRSEIAAKLPARHQLPNY